MLIYKPNAYPKKTVLILQNNVALRSLNLAMNGFSTRGATAVGQALTKNVTLTDLDLTFNRIYDDAAVSLAKGLVANESLKYLYVSRILNSFSCMGNIFRDFPILAG